MTNIPTLLLGVTLLMTTGYAAQGPERRPAVAGQFYPADPVRLEAMLSDLFAKAEAQGTAVPREDDRVLAIILPHAGYVFSGQVAASGVARLGGDEEYENVFLIGASHHSGFAKAAVFASGSFLTPLGRIEVNGKTTAELLEHGAFVTNDPEPHGPEHSLEVELPLLQHRLKKPFRIVPVLLGDLDVAALRGLAAVLKPYLNEKNLFIISSDFSHYPGYQDANRIDAETLKAILANSPEALLRSVMATMQAGDKGLATCACGLSAILTLLFMTADDPRIRIDHVRYMNSGDVGIGPKDRVVGYHSVTFSGTKERTSMTQDADLDLTDKDKKDLLAIARKTIEEYLDGGRTRKLDAKSFSPNLRKPCGAFVTLNQNGRLRGCIGNFSAPDPLYQVVQRMAIAAATEDPRFSPVTGKELEKIDIEISVLSPMRKIGSIDEIKLGTHGVYIRKGVRSGTFLPQVATETGWTLEEFLGHCSEDKAGLGWDGWKSADIFIYSATVFGEKEDR
jgi:AmmeMemoRadiSam system protein B/AmmeMemoRadiSam system protein A